MSDKLSDKMDALYGGYAKTIAKQNCRIADLERQLAAVSPLIEACKARYERHNQEHYKISGVAPDLSNKSVEELRNEVAVRLDAYGQNALHAFDELARRLEEAQQKIAEAKAEALEEARDSIMMDMSTKMCKDPLDIVSYLREQSAEYRANAKGDKP